MDVGLAIYLSVNFLPIYTSLLIILLICSAFFSMCEITYSTVNKIRLKTLIEDNKKGARKALYLAENYDKVLAAILVGNNLANIAITTLAVRIFAAIILNGSDGLIDLITTVTITIIVLIFGEILPKSLGKAKAETISIKFSGLMYVLMKILTPITFPFYHLNKAALKNVDSNEPSVTEDELETIIDTMESEGSIETDEANMLQRVLDLREVDVKDIETPRVDMIAIDVETDVDEVKDIFFKYQFSRIPIYEETRDNIIGILYEREFYTKLIKNQAVNIRKLARKPLFVANTMKADALIELFRNENNHIAIVLDEYGGVDGIVTMEDALEELVGEIFDEHDEVPLTIHKIKDNEYLVNGDFELENLFEELDLGEKPEDIDATTVGGLITEKLERLPKVGDEISLRIITKINYSELDEEDGIEEKDLLFKVKSIKNRRITRVALQIIDQIEGEDE